MSQRDEEAWLRAVLDQEAAAGCDAMRQADFAALLHLRIQLAEEDSRRMLRRLSPEQADWVARLALWAFDTLALQAGLIVRPTEEQP